MSKSKISQKKLKAIVFTDMADFTKISSQDEEILSTNKDKYYYFSPYHRMPIDEAIE